MDKTFQHRDIYYPEAYIQFFIFFGKRGGPGSRGLSGLSKSLAGTVYCTLRISAAVYCVSKKSYDLFMEQLVIKKWTKRLGNTVQRKWLILQLFQHLVH